MNSFLSKFSKKQSLLYKGLLFLSATLLIIYFLPKGGQFKYNYDKGKPWQYDNLYAPFSFTIKKDKETLEQEAIDIRAQAIPFLEFDESVLEKSIIDYEALIAANFVDSLHTIKKETALSIGKNILTSILKDGYTTEIHNYESNRLVYLKKGNEIEEVLYSFITTTEEAKTTIKQKLANISEVEDRVFIESMIERSLLPNVLLNTELTEASIQKEINAINPNQGVIEKNARIIAKGEVVEGNKYKILNSLSEAYKSEVWSKSNQMWLLVAYAVLISLVFLMLFLFLKKYRLEIFENNTKVTFIFFNIVLMVFLTTLIIDYNAAYVYVIPLCVLPLVLKAFFDPRLGLFVHVLTLLLLGFIVPNSFEYLFLQIIAGVVTILTVSELYKRANLFISVAQITFVYIVGYFAFSIIHEGNIDSLEWEVFGLFIICGLVTLFAHPLIYFYEKIFGLVSDVSLLELSDTNSKLLKELSNKAPGTFHHSLNVANLAEAAANEIGANAMLVRVGALYHDIGKMKNPTMFIENQVNTINTHDELDPKESATVIIDHIINGIELARKYKLPDRIIDFIRTHHGTTLVYFFYKKEKEKNGIASIKDFTYPGPIPFSKETAILMMADSVEAASKSLKEPTSSKINDFVEKIIDSQMEQGQFLNANVTFKEIQQIKKVLKKKLNNIFHLRIEYPE